MTDFENDIGTALMRLRAAFAKHDVPCPDLLQYSDPEKALEAIRHARHMLGPNNWAMTKTGAAMGEYLIAGFSLLYKPQLIERPGTGMELDDGITYRVFSDGDTQ